MNAANILTGNLTVDFNSLSRLGQLRIIEGHYDCGALLAARLLGSDDFEAIVKSVECARLLHDVSAGCATHRMELYNALRA